MPMDMELRDYLARAVERGATRWCEEQIKALGSDATAQAVAAYQRFKAEVEQGAHRSQSYAEADAVITELAARGYLAPDGIPRAEKLEGAAKSEMRKAALAFVALVDALENWPDHGVMVQCADVKMTMAEARLLAGGFKAIEKQLSGGAG